MPVDSVLQLKDFTLDCLVNAICGASGSACRVTVNLSCKRQLFTLVTHEFHDGSRTILTSLQPFLINGSGWADNIQLAESRACVNESISGVWGGLITWIDGSVLPMFEVWCLNGMLLLNSSLISFGRLVGLRVFPPIKSTLPVKI